VRLGLVSDTFGNLDALARALDLFVRAQAERVFFLGGRVADLDAVLLRRATGKEDPLSGRVVRVASRACPEYQGGKVPRKQLDLVDGKVACLVHDKSELTRDDIENATLILHGNSGQPAMVAIGARCFVTPGHLRRPAPSGRPATFVLLETAQRELLLTVFSEDAAELRKEKVTLARGTKLSVR
jgi:predicted phosphodiesterase